MARKGSGHKSDKVFAKMKRLYDDGLSMNAIAEAFPGEGCAETIRKEFKRRGVDRRGTGPLRNPIDDAEMLRLYDEGHSLVELGERYGVSEGTIRNHLEKLGRARRGKGSSRGDKHGMWRGGVHVKKGGHILVKSPNHPHRNRLGYVRVHRLVVEEALGGFLLPFEVVHHDDHTPGNNALSNLRLFCGRDEHDLYGHPERVWGISRLKVGTMLRRIRALRAKRRSLLTPAARRARRMLRRSTNHFAIRARMVVSAGTRYVQVQSRREGRRQEHEHRHVMAKIIGRDPTTEERVHHEDGDRSNNDPRNLFLFRCNGDHIQYHNWKGIAHFRGRPLADKFLEEKCVGMHNQWQPSASRKKRRKRRLVSPSQRASRSAAGGPTPRPSPRASRAQSSVPRGRSRTNRRRSR